MYVLALHRMVYWYIATETSPSMKIFRFAAKTIANCTHKSSCQNPQNKRRLWPTSIRLGCLATCFATNLLGHHGCSRLGCICCMRGFLEVGDEESESIKTESHSFWKAWDATFYTTATCNRSWNVFHRSMSDFIGRFSGDFDMLQTSNFSRIPWPKKHGCQGKCAGQIWGPAIARAGYQQECYLINHLIITWVVP